MPASPARLAQQNGHTIRVVFQGFQQLDLPSTPSPYTRRCRLWPAGEDRSSAIINVLIESSEQNADEQCTLHSRFAIVNNCLVRLLCS